MPDQQHKKWQQLCLMAVKEPDPKKQLAIVAELKRILQSQRKRTQSARACVR